MFTGIVQAVGRIVRLQPLEIDCGTLELADVAVGDSICVQGVCLTVTARTARGFTADVSRETLAVTAGLDRPAPDGQGPTAGTDPADEGQAAGGAEDRQGGAACMTSIAHNAEWTGAGPASRRARPVR